MYFGNRKYSLSPVIGAKTTISLCRVVLGSHTRSLFWLSVVSKDKFTRPTHTFFSNGHIQEVLHQLELISTQTRAFEGKVPKGKTLELFSQAKAGIEETYTELTQTERFDSLYLILMFLDLLDSLDRQRLASHC